MKVNLFYLLDNKILFYPNMGGLININSKLTNN